jgi:hypothetical protein
MMSGTHLPTQAGIFKIGLLILLDFQSVNLERAAARMAVAL